jgi:4-hydroxybenzoate polyprenyltransferase
MLLAVSRPRFWIYLLGPFLIGLVSQRGVVAIDWPVLVMGIYFTWPANLLIYGVNDIFDYDSDRLNPKKRTYEQLVSPKQYTRLAWIIVLTNLPFLLIGLLHAGSLAARWALAGFVFFGVFYSAPPIRAKAIPLIDSIFNVLYIFPGLYAYALLTGKFAPISVTLAALLWCMAMHAYSAIPDIRSDKRAGLQTIATWLGVQRTLWFCLVCYIGAAILIWPILGWFGLLLASVYLAAVGLLLLGANDQSVFSLYRLFPYLNMAVGTALFFFVALVK